MLSVASVRSASGAAEYYATDNYYSRDAQAETSEWAGEGARRLGLDGTVNVEKFAEVLSGKLSAQEQIDSAAGDNRRVGFDLTFSAPKTVSLLALVGGDKRLLDAQREAVKATLGWAEQRFAEARLGKDGKTTVATENLIVAMFQHDTSRARDPNLHTHAIVVNATQRPDGAWRALKNDQLYRENRLIGAVYHNELRSRVAALGYEIKGGGKNGMFEIAGVDRQTIEAWSTRGSQIKEIANRLGIVSPEGRAQIAVRSREDKQQIEPDALQQMWQDMAAKRGENFAELIASPSVQNAERGVLGRLREWGENLLDRAIAFWRPKPEPLLSDQADMRRCEHLGGAYAVAVAARHLGEREATFSHSDLLRESLNFAEQHARVGTLEKRIDTLIGAGDLVRGRGEHQERLTTPDMIRTEREMLAYAKKGVGAVDARSDAENGTSLIQKGASQALGFALSDEQLAAAQAILYGDDRVMMVQGDAGTGKSTVFAAINAVPEDKRPGLAMLTTQSGLARTLQRESGIETHTLAWFQTRYEDLAATRATATAKDREVWAGKVLVVDEASMLSSRQMLGLFRIADKLGVERIALVGDKAQIKAIEAGRPFAQLQENLQATRLSENRRQRDPQMREVVRLLREGSIAEACNALGGRLMEIADPARAAADHWLGLPPKQRDASELLTSGHRLRGGVLARLDEAKGEGRASITLDIWKNRNLTREEMRQSSKWEAGQQLDLYRDEPRLGLRKGSYLVHGPTERQGEVIVEAGERQYRVLPGLLHPTGKGASLSEPHRVEIQEGDRLMVTGKIERRGVVNGDRFTLEAIKGSSLELLGRDGRRHVLEAGDPMRERLDQAAALNMHRVQGQTFENAIAAMSAQDTRLNARDLAYVLASRARDGFTLYVDDVAKLAQQIERNDGRSPHALDLLGEGTKSADAPRDLRDQLTIAEQPKGPDKTTGDVTPPAPRNEARSPDAGKDSKEAEQDRNHVPKPPVLDRSKGMEL
ncbi:MAG: MobF family relaxase [Sphingomonadaceae bacterium]